MARFFPGFHNSEQQGAPVALWRSTNARNNSLNRGDMQAKTRRHLVARAGAKRWQIGELFRLLRGKLGQRRLRLFAFGAEMHAFAFGAKYHQQ